MIRRIVTAAAFVLGLAALPAFAAPANPNANKVQTVPHVDMSLASIQSGQSYASGLFDMARESGAYDAGHASMFKQHIASDIGMAETHLGHLAGVAAGNADARNALQQANQHLAAAKSALDGIDPKGMAPQAIASRTKEVYAELGRAQDRVSKVASDLGVSSNLEKP